VFVDGHKPHLTYQLSVLCNELKIEVIALYPNPTRILQPADVAVFRPVKMYWRKSVITVRFGLTIKGVDIHTLNIMGQLNDNVSCGSCDAL
jgi:hypothetical protein